MTAKFGPSDRKVRALRWRRTPKSDPQGPHQLRTQARAASLPSESHRGAAPPRQKRPEPSTSPCVMRAALQRRWSLPPAAKGRLRLVFPASGRTGPTAQQSFQHCPRSSPRGSIGPSLAKFGPSVGRCQANVPTRFAQQLSNHCSGSWDSAKIRQNLTDADQQLSLLVRRWAMFGRVLTKC